jgi:hypothetical protein
MAKDKKDKESLNIKDGVSVHEIEGFVKKHLAESFIVLAVIIGTISSVFDFFTRPSWSLIFAGIGAIVSIIFPEKISELMEKCSCFLKKQEKASQIVIGIVRIVLAIFIPFVIFAEIGLLAGCKFSSCYKCLVKPSNDSKEIEIEKRPPDDEEHL